MCSNCIRVILAVVNSPHGLYLRIRIYKMIILVRMLLLACLMKVISRDCFDSSNRENLFSLSLRNILHSTFAIAFFILFFI